VDALVGVHHWVEQVATCRSLGLSRGSDAITSHRAMATAAAAASGGASVITALSHVVVPVGPEQLAPTVRFYTDMLQFEQYLETTPGRATFG